MALTREQLNQRIQVAKAQGWDDARIRRSLQTTLAKNGGLAQSAPVQQPKKSPGLIAQLAPILGSVGGAVVGGLATGGIGALAGGAAGGAAGERYRQKASGEEANWGNVAKEGAFGALGNLGGAIKAVRGVSTLAKGAKVADALYDAGTVAKVGKTIKGAGNVAKAGQAVNRGNKVQQTLQTAAKGIDQSTRQIRLPASVYGAGKEEAVNATLDALKFKGNAASQYKQLAPAMKRVEDQLGAVAKANPNVKVKVADIKASFFKNLDSQVRTGELNVPTAQREVTKYIGDLTKRAGSKNGELDLRQLRDIKKLVNSDYEVIANKLEKGLPLTPTQKVAQVAWDSLDGAVTKASPEMKALLTQQSHLYSAAPSLKAARVNPPTLRGLGSSLPVFATDAMRYGASQTLKGAANVAGAASNPTLGRAAQGLGYGVNAGVGGMAGRAVFGGDQAQGQEAPQEMDLLDQYLTPDEGMDSLGQAPQQGAQYDPNTIVQMLQQDLAATGGKNFSKIQTMAKFMQEAAGGTGTGAKQSKLSDTAIQNVTDIQTAMSDLDGLRTALTGSTGVDIPGIGYRVNAPTTQTKITRSEVDRVRQVVGKALEGGVLRKEDEEKYKRILPTVNDSMEVAQAKIDSLMGALEQRLSTFTNLQNSRGSGQFSTDPYQQMVSGLNSTLTGY